jgi:hypothetical protein
VNCDQYWALVLAMMGLKSSATIVLGDGKRIKSNVADNINLNLMLELISVTVN